MAVHKLDIFHSDGRLRNYEHWSIYALFCEISKEEAIVKIGMTSIIYDRLLALQAGISFPLSMCLHAPVGARGLTAQLEARLHRAFKNRNTRGEWFIFNTANANDKKEFHETTKRLYERYVEQELAWKKITADQLRAYSAFRRKAA